MLRDAELAALRATMEVSFPHTCQVYRTTAGVTSDGQGGTTGDTEAPTFAATIACRLIARQPREGEFGGAVGSELAWTALLPHDADVRVADRLKVGADYFEVVGTDKEQSERVALSVSLVRLS